MITVNHPEAIGWKHNHEPGIRTREGVITAWPETLGDMPTQEQVEQWEIEWLAFVNDPVNSPTTLDDVIHALSVAGVPLDIVAAKRARL